MGETIGLAGILKMIRSGMEKIRANHVLLSRLDAATGDGDHGTTMLRVVDAVDQVIKESGAGQLKQVLYDLGWGVMGVDGGSTGPLLGSFFMGFSDAAPETGDLDAKTFAALFGSGLAKIQEQTKAQVGDKTMMDTLVPAIAAITAAAGEGKGIAEILKAGAAAATTGAESTKDLVAKFGRARNLAQRTIGHVDAGATSMAFMFQGFAEAV